jgi:hypothetical protein
MITLKKKEYEAGFSELRFGIASWDNGSLTKKSLKYAYQDKNGRISRGSPELPIRVVIDLLLFAAENGALYDEFDDTQKNEAKPIAALTHEELSQERKDLASAAIILNKLQKRFSSIDFKSIQDQIDTRKSQVKQAIDLMSL